MSRFCSECGTKIPDGVSYCPECGKPVEMPAPAINNNIDQQNSSINNPYQQNNNFSNPAQQNTGYGNPYAGQQGAPYGNPYNAQPGYGAPAGVAWSLGSDKQLVGKVPYALLAFFLGGFGAHKFYAGKIGWGIGYLLLSWTFLPAVLAVIEMITGLCANSDPMGRIYA